MSKKIVKQDYKLVNARYKLNRNELKLILIGISNLKDTDEDDKIYTIKLSEISEELNNESLTNKHTRLKNFCENLLKKPLYIPEPEGNFLVANWFSSLRYIKGKGELQYRISTDLKPYLVELKKRFVKYNLKNIIPLTSTYAIRIYQFLKEYEKLKTRIFELEELQEILQVPKSYQIYNRFKEKALIIAQKEINEHTDLNFDYEEIKSGRKVTHLKFFIKQKKQEITDETKERINKFLKLCLHNNKKELEKVFIKYINLSDEVIESNIAYVNNSDTENYIAYLTSALNNDYAKNSREVMKQLEVESIEEVKDIKKLKIKAKKCYDEVSGNCGHLRYGSLPTEDFCKYCPVKEK